MKKWIKKRKKILILLAVMVVLVVQGVRELHQNSHVRFEDKNMGILICNTIGGGVTPETVRYRDLKKVKILETGFVGFYDTLIDIKKCKNLEEVYINGGSLRGSASYKITKGEKGETKTPEEVERLQEELEEILPGLRRLKDFSFTNVEKNCEIINIDFLKECRKLETVWIYYCDISDYSVLKKIAGIKYVYLTGSGIETADDLLELKNLEEMFLDETPLSQNKKEMQKLYEAFPKAKIIV